MCKTCAYNFVYGNRYPGATYRWVQGGIVKYEITCSASSTSSRTVMCDGLNNENNGRPRYTGTCPPPTRSPTRAPTSSPTRTPTQYPTQFPTRFPTRTPSHFPTRSPTRHPTSTPSRFPTRSPTRHPTRTPSQFPTRSPTSHPTRFPTRYPTRYPTVQPTQCQPISTATADAGYTDNYRGWYDVQGCGRCNDYCRWVGNSGSGGNPAHNLGSRSSHGNPSWWSCRLAGQNQNYSPRHQFNSFPYRKCVGRGAYASHTFAPVHSHTPHRHHRHHSHARRRRFWRV